MPCIAQLLSFRILQDARSREENWSSTRRKLGSSGRARAPASHGLASYLICFPEVIGEGRKLNRGCVTGEGGCRAMTSRCRWDRSEERRVGKEGRLTRD